MNINGLIINTLKPTGVPVSLRTYTGNEPQYITFFTEDYPELSADDEEEITGYFVQIEVFSKINYTNLVNTVKDLMIQAGFNRINFRDDPYSSEIGMFHKVMTFSFSAHV
ncbi:hypothetical protein [Caldibacillus thermoamylovorans]|uniref:hypothetical protein n=1 Tax=Caldibacillus thermoamylovorans TaxID=35841 RepID=UPI0022E32208|nr:hypothetical protein [Caldibacillus thermoamylovorans]